MPRAIIRVGNKYILHNIYLNRRAQELVQKHRENYITYNTRKGASINPGTQKIVQILAL